MVDQGKDAGLRAREAPVSTASDHQTHAQAERRPRTPAGRAAPRNGLSEHTRNRLAVQLREMYDTVTEQPVPDRFAELIAKLDSAERGKA
ncbi:anti-sigma factor [Methylobacterium sp. J-026]|uniref:NepR family anti-sigma factor n=1 Tax=Methylobacterium sp. J-026 TaxID=2836624 RepID=UPI001FBA6392|nr:NepR family anti-sigma factor [Methylobacterium sp. J-026]MCJ2136774.1 anti-sigma factor [Methylobacterium sp. J-026]